MHDQYLNFGKVTHYWHTNLHSNYLCGFVVSFVVTGDTTESFWAVNLVVFKKKKEKLLVLIFLTWFTDSLAPNLSFEPNFVSW